MKSKNNMIQEALRYHALGFSIIPVGRDKKPLIQWKKYQTEKASVEQITAWFTQYPDMNIAVVTGTISGIVVIDVEKGGNTDGLPPTVTVKTGGDGWHYYYQYPGIPVGNSARKIAPLTDVRGDGGYVVLPPSIHASGKSYEWLQPLENSFSNIPEDLLHKITDDSTPPSKQIDITEVMEGGRNDAATKYIGRVLHSLPSDLWDTAGWSSLKEWNATKSKPPLSENELRGIFNSIRKREQGQKNHKDLLSSPSITFTPFTLANLYEEEFPESRWVVQDLIPFGTITALTGDSNSYKTFLTQCMAASVATGKPFLDHFSTTQGKVLIIDEENHRKHTKERFKSMEIAGTPSILLLPLAGVKIDNDKHIQGLRELLDKEKPALVIFDSLVRLHGGEENSATEMAKAFGGMKQLVDDSRAIIFIHHHRKQQGFGKNTSSQSIRGSSDILAAVDTHLAVDRDDTKITVTQTKMRLQPEIKPFKVDLVTTFEGQVSFTYQGEDTDLEDRIQEACLAVKKLITASTDPLTLKVLARETKLPGARLRQAIKNLEASNEIAVKNRGAHGVHYYGLPDPIVDDLPDSSPVYNYYMLRF